MTPPKGLLRIKIHYEISRRGARCARAKRCQWRVLVQSMRHRGAAKAATTGATAEQSVRAHQTKNIPKKKKATE